MQQLSMASIQFIQKDIKVITALYLQNMNLVRKYKLSNLQHTYEITDADLTTKKIGELWKAETGVTTVLDYCYSVILRLLHPLPHPLSSRIMTGVIFLMLNINIK